MPLHLTFLGTDRLPVEVEGLTPDALRGKTAGEIERFELFHGKDRRPLADLFQVRGDLNDERIEFEGDLTSVHRIGARMSAGEIRITGSAGRHVGSEMTGGAIHVTGNVGDWAGAEMAGGLLDIRGDAGDLAGAAYRGSAKGMRGGTLLVHGSAGHEVGHTMRRGLIAIGGAAGSLVGTHMIAGTILVFGGCGVRPGAGMRRGTIGLFGDPPPELLASFRYGSTFQPQFLALYFRELTRHGFHVPPAVAQTECALYHGDRLAVGKGEILLRA